VVITFANGARLPVQLGERAREAVRRGFVKVAAALVDDLARWIVNLAEDFYLAGADHAPRIALVEVNAILDLFEMARKPQGPVLSLDPLVAPLALFVVLDAVVADAEEAFGHVVELAVYGAPVCGFPFLARGWIDTRQAMLHQKVIHRQLRSATQGVRGNNARRSDRHLDKSVHMHIADLFGSSHLKC
jgi:hypothetical protein